MAAPLFLCRCSSFFNRFLGKIFGDIAAQLSTFIYGKPFLDMTEIVRASDFTDNLTRAILDKTLTLRAGKILYHFPFRRNLFIAHLPSSSAFALVSAASNLKEYCFMLLIESPEK